MIAERCRDASRSLLEFYVNGTLEREEAEAVRAHLDSCERCSKETQELTEIAAELDPSAARVSASPGAVAPPIGRRRRSLTIAAVFLVPLLAGLLWLVSRPALRAPGIAGTASEPVVMDLGSGPVRDGNGSPSPPLLLRPAAGPVVFLFIVPLHAGSRYAAELLGPGGRVLAGPTPLVPPDAYGRARFEVSRGGVTEPGDHELVVIRIDPVGEEREYRFPFRVMPPATGAEHGGG